MAPKKMKRVAIIGAGLSGLAAALALSEKGYETVIFEKSDRLGGRIWEISEDILPRELIHADFEVFKTSDTVIRTAAHMKDKADLMRIRDDFNAVYLAYGRDRLNPFELEFNEDNQIQISPVTLNTSDPKMFAGGSLRLSSGRMSPITSLSDGKRAAISIDRFLQNVSITASREREGAYTTQLYTNLDGLTADDFPAPFDELNGYSEGGAAAEAGRCLQCQCLECIKVCKYLEHYEKYPKKYIREISNNFTILFGKKRAKTMINSCSMCGLCGEVCPNSLNMGEVSSIARNLMVEKGQMPMAIHDFPVRDMIFSNSGKCELHQNQPGFFQSRYAFFPGCQLSAIMPEYIGKTYSYLIENLKGGVGLMLRCCGAPAKWSGRKELFDTVSEEFYRDWTEMGKPEMIMACATCYKEIGSRFPEIEMRPLWEIYDQYGLPQNAPEKQAGRKITVHDPCTSRYNESFHTSVRSIIKKMGYSLEELSFSKNKTKCCGYGGLIFYSDPRLTEEIVKSRMEESSLDYITYCINCTDYFSKAGKLAYHLLGIIYGNGEYNPREKSIGYSQRQENRTRLKEQMLKEFWCDMTERVKEEHELIKLIISDETMDLLEKRLILKEDIQKVLYHAEKCQTIVYNAKTGNLVAHFKPRIITYWVEYTKESDRYIIHNAYSHRLELIENVINQ
jgi:Fe-S oxidoreductase